MEPRVRRSARASRRVAGLAASGGMPAQVRAARRGARRGAPLLALLSLSTLSTSAAMAAQRQLQHVFLTGATDGIGRYTAGRLARIGQPLLVHGRSEAKGEALRAELLAEGSSEVIYLAADLSDTAQVEGLAQRAEEALGGRPLGCLCNNAGVYDPDPALAESGVDATWQVNVVAPYVLTRRMLGALLRAEEPMVITTSSISQSYSLDLERVRDGTIGQSPHSAYSASKLGDRMFCAGLARRADAAFGPGRLRSICHDPGTVNTKMLLSGWGSIGIPVKKANNTFDLITGSAGRQGENGSYYFGGGGSPDAGDAAKVDALFALLEEQSGGVSYGDMAEAAH